MKHTDKVQTTYRLTEAADRWITEQAKTQGISKNDVIQILVNTAMDAAAPIKSTA